MTDYKETISRMQVYAHITYRVILGCHFIKPLSGHVGKFWPYIQNCTVEATILHWCHLFLDRNDDLFYKKFFNRDEVKGVDENFTAENVKARILAKIELDEAGFIEFWNKMKSLRDQWIAHKDLDRGSLTIPEIKKCRLMAEELRTIIGEWCNAAYAKDKSEPELWGWAGYFQKENPEFLKRLADSSWNDREKMVRGDK
jgi:hypothetical protein